MIFQHGIQPLEPDVYPNPSSGIFNLYFENFNIENIDINVVIFRKISFDRIYSFQKIVQKQFH